MVSKVLLHCLSVIAAIAINDVFALEGTWQDGYNLFWARHCEYTDHYSTRFVRSWRHCGPICQNDERCAFFTWTREFGGSCHLYDETNRDILSARPSYGKICGYVNKQADKTDENIFWNDAYYYFWGQNCRLFLFDFFKLETSTGKECAVKCFQNERCKFYTWVKYNKACYFKEMADYDTKFSPSFADPRTDLECGFLKPFIDGPSIPTHRWNDNQVGFWSDDCSFTGRHVLTRRAISFWDCAHECTYYPTCRFYTWFPANSGTCILKSRDGFKPDSVTTVKGDRCGFIKNI